MGYRIVETQESVQVMMYPVSRDRGVVVWTESLLIDAGDYAPGVFDALREAWDRGDYYEVQYVELEPRTGRVLNILDSIGDMAGYGGAEAAACAAAYEHFVMPPDELESLAKQAGCDRSSRSGGRAMVKPGVKFDLDGVPDTDGGQAEDVFDDSDPDEPQDGDYFIQNGRRGGYYVTQYGKVLWDFSSDDYDDIERVIWHHMDAHQFWPNVWRVGERGDTDLVIIKPPKGVTFDLDGLPGSEGRGILPSWAMTQRMRVSRKPPFILFDRVTQRDAKRLVRWWDAHTPHYHEVRKSTDRRFFAVWRVR
jgi:hypothetical protein